HHFAQWCVRNRLGRPVTAVRNLFLAFKVVQLAVFATWWWVFADGSIAVHDRREIVLAVGVLLLIVGQWLNAAVFYRLGATGVFFGDRFGHATRRCRAFPFSLIAHPQYVGALLSIWGLFFAVRFPHADWLAIPALETIYYAMGARLERLDG